MKLLRKCDKLQMIIAILWTGYSISSFQKDLYMSGFAGFVAVCYFVASLSRKEKTS